MEKIEKIYLIIQNTQVFYPYLIKKIYECYYKEKILMQHINYALKTLERLNFITKITKVKFIGNYSWGNISIRTIYILNNKITRRKVNDNSCFIYYLKKLKEEVERNDNIKNDIKELLLKKIKERLLEFLLE